jgi:predicted AlkP superfamily pyrophosphatase or phosphodiesterase
MHRSRSARPRLLAVLALLLALAALAPARPQPPAAQPAAPERPRLAVLVVFDQLRADYLERWRKLFGPGGFRRLMEEGAWFRNCHYPYAATLTSPGHASMATGAVPASHGIIANDWYDRAARNRVAAVRTERYRPVPERPGAP